MFRAHLYEPVPSTKSIKAIHQSFKKLIIDGADKTENMCSIDVTTRISRGITVCSQPV